MKSSSSIAIALIACSLSAAPTFIARADDAAPAAVTKSDKRSADAIIAEIQSAKPPEFDSKRRGDQAYVTSYIAELEKANQHKADLAKELYDSHPENPKAVDYLLERWMILARSRQTNGMTEAEQFLKDHADSPRKADVLYQVAFMHVMTEARQDPAKPMEAVERFIAAKPDDDRGARLLYMLADAQQDSEKATALHKRILKDFPSSDIAKVATGQLRRTEGVGKPFELAFTDATSGAKVSMAALKGKVVVVDFWATWCGPCVAEMPNMKKLYAEYKDKGVEFIGVSLDMPAAAGGLEKLKQFCEKEQIKWPQYHQGNGWESEFSASWGISSIPCVFVVDADGKLYSTEARGQLEKLIPELIKKRDGEIK